MNDKFLQFLGIAKKAGKLFEGYNKCEESIKNGKITILILSKEVSQNTRDKFVHYCEKANVTIIDEYSKEQLGAQLGVREINIVGIGDKKMCEKLMSLFKEKTNM